MTRRPMRHGQAVPRVRTAAVGGFEWAYGDDPSSISVSVALTVFRISSFISTRVGRSDALAVQINRMRASGRISQGASEKSWVAMRMDFRRSGYRADAPIAEIAAWQRRQTLSAGRVDAIACIDGNLYRPRFSMRSPSEGIEEEAWAYVPSAGWLRVSRVLR